MIARHLHILKMTHFNVASNIFESSLFSTNLANAGEDVFSSSPCAFGSPAASRSGEGRGEG